MQISVLASGSSGNCTFISSNESNILVDAGITLKRIRNNLDELGKDLNELNGVFVTHEHSDHIKALEKLDKENVPVFINKETYMASKLQLNNLKLITDTKFEFNDLMIKPTSISHDGANPYGYKVTNKNKTAGVFTDLGIANHEVKSIIKDADAMVLETNHDIDMVLNGRYPYHLKQRILGDKGHLSNIDAGLLVKNHASEKLKNVFLSHISKNNNTDELALNTLSQLTSKLNINKILTNDKFRTEFIKI
jgi:phosphoribosyl 1,2-cyclic phosphodiesterase